MTTTNIRQVVQQDTAVQDFVEQFGEQVRKAMDTDKTPEFRRQVVEWIREQADWLESRIGK